MNCSSRSDTSKNNIFFDLSRQEHAKLDQDVRIGNAATEPLYGQCLRVWTSSHVAHSSLFRTKRPKRVSRLSSARTLLMSDSVKSVAFTGYDWQLLFELSLPLLPVRVERMEDLLFLWEGRL